MPPSPLPHTWPQRRVICAMGCVKHSIEVPICSVERLEHSVTCLSNNPFKSYSLSPPDPATHPSPSESKKSVGREREPLWGQRGRKTAATFLLSPICKLGSCALWFGEFVEICVIEGPSPRYKRLGGTAFDKHFFQQPHLSSSKPSPSFPSSEDILIRSLAIHARISSIQLGRRIGTRSDQRNPLFPSIRFGRSRRSPS